MMKTQTTTLQPRPIGAALLLLLLLVVAGPTSTKACSCVRGSTELANSLPGATAAATVKVGQEITPQPHDINAPRYWDATIVNVYQGCGLGTTTLGAKIVVRTGGNSALCGTELAPNTKYVLVGDASKESVKELKFTNGPILSINSCTFHKPLAEVTEKELSILNALDKPKCDSVKKPINCETCPRGFFDGCNSCSCGANGQTAGCTKRFCPPGTYEDNAVCNDPPPPPPSKCCDPFEKPGFGTNPPGCKEGFECCPEGNWSCSIGDGTSFPCGGVIINTGFGKQCDVPIVCTDDVFACPDGSFVSRDPTNDCKFPECEDNTVFCTADVKTCPDGSFVSRNSKRGCAFDPCPLNCDVCPFGFFDGCNTCGCNKGGRTFCSLRACGPNDFAEPKCNPKPDPVVCPADAKLCIDGSSVGRDPNNNCEFVPCPPPSCKVCPFGFNDGCNDCRCDKNGNESCTDRACLVQGEPFCKEPVMVCGADVSKCPDGSFVSRNPKLGCAFDPCPVNCDICPFGFFDGCNSCGCDKGGTTFCTLRACGPDDFAEPKCNPKPDPVVCPADAKLCVDGSSLGRDPSNNCEFFPCPPPNCKVCPFGFNDGCNECRCDKNGNESCTERACKRLGEPFCVKAPVCDFTPTSR
jgi:hypothetical protein